MMDHLTHENFRVDLPRAEREKMPRERYRKWMKLKERQGWDSGKISRNFSEKICGGAEEGEERCFNFWVSESCFKFQTTDCFSVTQIIFYDF